MPLSISHQGETGNPLVCRFHDHIPDKGNHRAVLKPVGESLALVLMQGGMCPTNPRQSTVPSAKHVEEDAWRAARRDYPLCQLSHAGSRKCTLYFHHAILYSLNDI